MSDTITLTREELNERLETAHRLGMLAQRLHDEAALSGDSVVPAAEGIKPRGVRPHLTAVQVRQHAAEVFNFPNPTKKTAS